jgi:hypothetical protein
MESFNNVRHNETVTTTVLEVPTCIVIVQWPDIIPPTIAEALISTDWTQDIHFTTIGIV